MAERWERVAPGIRCRLHASRKHGVRPDRYYVLRFAVGGQKHQEALGWSSEGWTLDKAKAELARLKEANRTGTGPVTLAEKRTIAEAKRQAETEARAQEERDALTLRQFFEATYYPAQQHESATGQKSPQSVRREEGLFRLYIGPVIGDRRLKDVAALDLERLKKRMHAQECAPRSIEYALATTRQVFNMARRLGIYAGDNPTGAVKKPKADNRRLRFLSHDEADRLLEALAKRTPLARDMALLALQCGLRAGEIFGLTWGDIDFERGVITVRGTSAKAGTRTKSGRTRQAFMTAGVRVMLEARGRGGHADLVFVARGGGKIVQISETFNRVVADLGFNDGVTDSRQKVVFHTLRHSFASWLVEQGVDLYTVKELMGHGTLAMTERYSHLAPEKLRRAVEVLEAGMVAARAAGKVVPLQPVRSSGE